MMKKAIALMLTLAMVLSLAACAAKSAKTNAAGSEPWGSALHWEEYDALIREIRTTTDTAKRVDLMHQAEDMVMDTWALLPIYYYNDPYMAKDYVSGLFTDVLAAKYFRNVELTNGSDTLNASISSEPGHLDPALVSSSEDNCLAVNTFEGLMTHDADGELVLGQAESYDISEDGLTYTFTMREGLKWSNGETLDADDFEYAWRRAADPANGADYAYLFEIFADGKFDADGTFLGLGENSLETSEDGRTLTAHLSAPCPYFLQLCAFCTFSPVHKGTVEATATEQLPAGTWASDAGTAFVCNGPFVLKSWNHDADMSYVKNEYYRDPDSVKLKAINFMLTADSSLAYTAFTDGSLDFIDLIPIDELGKLTETKNPNLHIADALGTFYVMFNYNSDLYQELGLDEEQAKVFRHALCLLVDRQYIIDNIGKTNQQPATTLVCPSSADGNGGIFKNKDYFPVDDYQANVEEAKRLLESIGLWDGQQLTRTVAFTVKVNEAETFVKAMEALQQDWAQVGIEASIQTEDWNVVLDERKSGQYDVARAGWWMDFNDPINVLEMWMTDSGNNDCQFGRVKK